MAVLGFKSVIVFIIDFALLEPKGGIKTIFNHFRNTHAREKRKVAMALGFLC